MIYVGILAGGQGTRMGNTEMPKQFLMLGSKPIIIHTIEQFIINPKIGKIIIAVPKMWISHMQDLIQKYVSNNPSIIIIEGGKSRNDTILNICLYIKDNFGLNQEEYLITHDAVRPFISQKIIEDNITAIESFDAVDTVIPAIDTIVESTDGAIINNIPKRDNMYMGQTPQTLNINQFISLYSSLTEEQKKELSDAAKIFVISNKKVGIVQGAYYNIKITTMYDLKIANAILNEGVKTE